MSEEQTQFSRRAVDQQIPLLAAKVGHLEATVESQGRWLQDVDHKIDDIRRELGDKLDRISGHFDQKTRLPMLPILGMLLTAGLFLLTIMTIVFKSHGDAITQLQHSSADHMDGHPVWVTKLMAEQFKAMQDRLAAVDATHTEAEKEKEEDIEGLRLQNLRNEGRDDTQDSRLAVLETQMAERSEFFDRYINIKAQDRWTRTQDDDRTKAFQTMSEQQHQSLEQQIQDTRQLIVGRKGGGFHQEHYKLQAVPRFKSLEERLDRLESKKQ